MSIVTKESNPELYNALFPKDEIKEILDKITDEDWYEELDLTGTKWIELKQEETNQLYDYITNLQKSQETLIKNDNEIIINLQEENKTLKNQLDFIEEQNHIIDKLEQENERLKELCDKYEEEHSTTFEYWKRLVKEDYKSRNEKAIEYLANCDWNCKDFKNLYDILGGDDNE